MSDPPRDRLPKWAIALTMLYFFGLGAGYLHLTFKRVRHSVVVYGPDTLLPGATVGFRVLAFSEQTGLPLEIRSVELRSPSGVVSPVRVDRRGRLVDLRLPLPETLRAAPLELHWRVVLAQGAIELSSRHNVIAPPRDDAIELPPATDRLPPEPTGVEAGYPLRLALSPARGRLVGNARNRLYLRVIGGDGVPLASASLAVRISGRKARTLRLLTDVNGLAEFELDCVAPIYKLRITVKAAREPAGSFEFVRHLAPAGRSFDARLKPSLQWPGSDQLVSVRFRALSRGHYRYCEHYWRGLWLASRRLEERDQSCSVALARAGLHFLVLADHYAAKARDLALVPLFASRKAPAEALGDLLRALAKAGRDTTYFERVASRLAKNKLTSDDSARLLGYALSLVPRTLTPLARLVDSRKADERSLEKTRTSGRMWLIRAMTVSSAVLLVVLLLLIGRTWIRLRRSLLVELADDDELANDRPALRSAADWFPLALLALIALACAALLMLFTQLD